MLVDNSQLAERLRKLHDKIKNTSGELSASWIGDAEAQAIAETLKENKTVTTIYFENRMGDAGAQAIAEVLKVNKTLTALYLDRNQIGDAGAQAIAEALTVNKTLTTLYLDWNQIGDAGAQAIAEALKENKTLTLLSLSENRIGDDGAWAIAEVLKVNTTLKKLHLNRNQIGDAGAQAIAEALNVNTTLSMIGLDGNRFSLSGVLILKAVCKKRWLHLEDVLQQSMTPRQLGLYDHVKNGNGAVVLSGNQIGIAEALAIAEALKVNTTLTMLFLQVNQIGDAGAQAIAEALKENKTLAQLDLHMNQIGDVGAHAIAEALKVNTTLIQLLLDGNSISHSGVTALKAACKANCQLSIQSQLESHDQVNGTTTGSFGMHKSHSSTAEAEESSAEESKMDTTVPEPSLQQSQRGHVESQGIAAAPEENMQRFVEFVRVYFASRSNIYLRFLALMDEYKRAIINKEALILEVSNLFQAYPHVLGHFFQSLELEASAQIAPGLSSALDHATIEQVYHPMAAWFESIKKEDNYHDVVRAIRSHLYNRFAPGTYFMVPLPADSNASMQSESLKQENDRSPSPPQEQQQQPEDIFEADFEALVTAMKNLLSPQQVERFKTVMSTPQFD
ncbi:hypothetical protein CAOG_08406 [Capsaspora owczarzaki ATCC 30864]|uniref:hypothetical protein n=1 Tax=Capsaspora owczarzaki (strain ATCC 30864) TaxID=595528 RepID=UPI0003524A00|nr:hypothetical protein CAOG_08406 [Capsaspora owczarzaki ATCC 30864]|eukprot:XP_011269977.1 hypothetical protein CAOG_08406 [Capsaspora owczarzaki ATCC 30864]